MSRWHELRGLSVGGKSSTKPPSTVRSATPKLAWRLRVGTVWNHVKVRNGCLPACLSACLAGLLMCLPSALCSVPPCWLHPRARQRGIFRPRSLSLPVECTGAVQQRSKSNNARCRPQSASMLETHFSPNAGQTGCDAMRCAIAPSLASGLGMA